MEDLKRIGDNLADLMIEGQPAGAEIRIDGRAAGKLPLKESLRIPIGTVEIEISARGYRSVRRERRIEPRAYALERVELVQIDAVPVPSEPQVPMGSPDAILAFPADDDSQDRKAQESQSTDAASPGENEDRPSPAPVSVPGTWKRPLAWVGIAGAAIALGGGVTFTWLHSQRSSQFNQEGNGCGAALPNRGVLGCNSKYESVQLARDMAIVGYSAAAVFGGISLYLLLTAPPSQLKEGDHQAGLDCLPQLGSPGIICSGRF